MNEIRWEVVRISRDMTVLKYTMESVEEKVTEMEALEERIHEMHGNITQIA